MSPTPLELLHYFFEPATETIEWFDVAARDARALLADLTDADWAALTSGWQTQPIEWRRRLAYALCGGNGARVAPIYREMFRDPDVPLHQCVAYGLRTLDDASLRAAVDEDNLQRLYALAKEPDHQGLAEQLLARLGEEPAPSPDLG